MHAAVATPKADPSIACAALHAINRTMDSAIDGSHNCTVGQQRALHSVSINLSYRITMELLTHDNVITPINVGDHDAVC